MSINFYLGKTIKFGMAPIFIRVQYLKEGISIRRKTDFYIEPDVWENRYNIQYLKKIPWIDKNQTNLFLDTGMRSICVITLYQ